MFCGKIPLYLQNISKDTTENPVLQVQKSIFITV